MAEDFVGALVRARQEGFDRLCLNCLAGFSGDGCPTCDVRAGDPLRRLREKHERSVEAGFAWDRWDVADIGALFAEIDRLKEAG